MNSTIKRLFKINKNYFIDLPSLDCTELPFSCKVAIKCKKLKIALSISEHIFFEKAYDKYEIKKVDPNSYQVLLPLSDTQELNQAIKNYSNISVIQDCANLIEDGHSNVHLSSAGRDIAAYGCKNHLCFKISKEGLVYWEMSSSRGKRFKQYGSATDIKALMESHNLIKMLVKERNKKIREKHKELCTDIILKALILRLEELRIKYRLTSDRVTAFTRQGLAVSLRKRGEIYKISLGRELEGSYKHNLSDPQHNIIEDFIFYLKKYQKITEKFRSDFDG